MGSSPPERQMLQLRQACISSVWSLSCQDATPGGHAGVGVVSLHGAPLSLPSLATPFTEFFRLEWFFLLLGNGGVARIPRGSRKADAH